MQFSKDEVRRLVIESLREMLKQDAMTDIPKIDDGTEPIRDLGRDSPDGVEFACVLSDKLKFHVPDEINPFVDDDGCRARRVGQIVDLIYNLLARPQEANHA